MAPKSNKQSVKCDAEVHGAAVVEGCRRSSLADFEAWMVKAGVTWDKSLIALTSGDGNGVSTDDAPWAVHAVRPVAAGSVLATLPRDAVLSAASCGLADVLRAERLGGGLALVAAVMYEAARGKKSKWYGYLSSLPAREYLPVYWSEEQLGRLEGCEMADKAREDGEAMAADFASELEPLLARYPARLGPLAAGWNLEAFRRAASWVASRAFYVDERHGDALVPLADVFNHKAARVELGGGGGWAEGFVVAEHADAQRQQHMRHGKRSHGHGGKEDEDGDDDEEEEEDDEDGHGEDEEPSGSGADSDADGEEVASGSGDSEEKDGEGDEPSSSGGDSDGGSDGCSSDENGGPERKRRKGSARASAAAKAQLDRDPGDDGDDPWPPPPPPPPPLQEAAADAAIADAAGGSANGDGKSARGARGRWGLLAEEAVTRGGRNLHLDIGICALERGGVEVLDIVAAQPLAEGAEVYNTYGEHGNAELVNKYGFALPYNPFDEVSLDKEALLAAAEAEVGRKAAQKAAKFLRKHSELLSEEEEPFLLLPPAHVSTPLYLALRVLAVGERELAGWRGIEDVLLPLRAAHKDEQQRATQQQQGEREPEGGAATADRKTQCKGEGSGSGGGKQAKRRRTSGSDAAAADGDGDGGVSASDQQRPGKRPRNAEGKGAAEDGTARAGRGKAGKGGLARNGRGADDDDEGGNSSEDDEDADDLPEDVEIATAASDRSTSAATAAGGLWTERMRALLRRAVEGRAAAYPTSLEQDEAELQRGPPQEERGGEGEPKAGKGSKGGRGKASKQRASASCTPAEAEAAWRAALTLRLGEQRLLAGVLRRL